MEIYRTDTHLILFQSPHRIEIPLDKLEKDYLTQAERILKELEKQSKFIPDENGNLVPIKQEQLIPDNWTRLHWLREARDEALLRTDYTQLPDAPITEELKEKYKKLRQKLRDLPDTVNLDLIYSSQDAEDIVQELIKDEI